MKFIVEKRLDGDWQWWLVAPNGREIAKSLPYKSRSTCIGSIRTVIGNVRDGFFSISDESGKLISWRRS